MNLKGHKAKAAANNRGGRQSIAAMLGRGASFEEIDAARAVVEAEDRARDRRKWDRTADE